MPNPHHKVGVINLNHLMAGAMVGGAVTLEIGENPARAKRVQQTQPGMERQAGKKILEAGGHQHLVLVIQQQEEMEVGVKQPVSAQMDHLKDGEAKPMMALVEGGLLGPGVDLAQ